ncbi:hypothetical protein [Botryobacter ruber]|uniref:hypothetical protein n=1 Tax=Botryobacter ruber TaxID=2171629 RepID=UPI000E0BAA8E|nr:hypothetical protein [Botryobacter ruber]
MGIMNSTDFTLSMVYYYYLPAFDNKPAEVIEVLHGDNLFVQVPLRDEDKRLRSFYQRPLTVKEVENFGKRQVWQIFTSWQELEDDHTRWNVPEPVLSELRMYQTDYLLTEAIAV